MEWTTVLQGGYQGGLTWRETPRLRHRPTDSLVSQLGPRNRELTSSVIRERKCQAAGVGRLLQSQRDLER